MASKKKLKFKKKSLIKVNFLFTKRVLNMTFRKFSLHFGCVIAALLMIGNVFADDENQDVTFLNKKTQIILYKEPKNETPPPSQEQESDPCCPKPAPKPVCCPKPEPCCPPQAACCPPLDPCCSFGGQCAYRPTRCGSFWASIDLLYWTAWEKGFGSDFGDTTITTTSAPGFITIAVDEHDKNIDFDWDPGFRVGIGYESNCSAWGADVYWTRFYQSGDSHSGPNHADWSLHFNTVDGIFGRKFWVGSCFDLRPFAGLRYALINQRLETHLETNVVSSAGTTSLILTNNHDRQRFWGIGPELGLQADWYFACGWSVYGTIDEAILYGNFRTHFNDSTTSTVETNTCHSNAEAQTCQGVFDVGIGARWENRYITLQAGLEHHGYSDFNQIGFFGNLNLFGANFSASFHY